MKFDRGFISPYFINSTKGKKNHICVPISHIHVLHDALTIQFRIKHELDKHVTDFNFKY